jgi:uncharacterized protein YebE (UPF0316 family)
MIARGQKNIAPILGFFEVLIWIVVASQVMQYVHNIPSYIAWAAGFAVGNYIGLLMEERIALGLQIIRIITHQECDELVRQLRLANHGTTVIDGHGAKGPVKVILTVVHRKNIEPIISIIRKNNPDAFYSIEDIRDVNRGVFSKTNKSLLRKMFLSEKI